MPCGAYISYQVDGLSHTILNVALSSLFLSLKALHMHSEFPHDLQDIRSVTRKVWGAEVIEKVDSLKTIRDSLHSILELSNETLSVQDVADELRVLHLLAEKNIKPVQRTAYDEIDSEMRAAIHLLTRLEIFFIKTQGAEKSVSENFKALIYATLEHISLRIGISASLQNPLTLFTNVVSFILNRVAEYSYVKAAKETQDIYFNQAGAYLREDLWQMLEKNSSLVNVTHEQGQEFKAMIGTVVEALNRAHSAEAYAQIYAMLVYATLFRVMVLLEKRV